jgi:tetratricopeptide (TPR) repeat protein
MTVRQPFTVLLALVACFFGAGCGGGDGLALSSETDDALYQQGKQLEKQGRNAEALTAFLKVAERRGEQSSPESHLEAGLIYLQHIKDPVEAIHHFRKYLELEPNSKQAPLVRQRIDLARRELFRTMPGRPSDEQTVRLGGQELIDRLQRENEDLKAELGRQRGSGPAPFLRTTRGPVDVVDVPKRVDGEADLSLRIAPPPPSFAAPPSAPLAQGQNGVAAKAAPSTAKAAAPAGKSAASAGKSAPSAGKSGFPMPAAGKRHSVAPGDSLYRVALKYGVTVEAILAVNRDALPSGVKTTLRQGMELKIP